MYSETRLFVGNIPENVSKTNLTGAFSVFGKIVNFNMKCKPTNAEDENKKGFAFITLQADSQNIENCIKHFTNQSFEGNQLYVTRARESFLEKLNRERAESKQNYDVQASCKRKKDALKNKVQPKPEHSSIKDEDVYDPANKRKQDADNKRIDSIRKKVQEFKKKQGIIKNGFLSVDKPPNIKLIFKDDDEIEELVSKRAERHKNIILFSDESDDDVTFALKKEFEGKLGQKVLDLQSRYKSDKRFTLDKRFIEEEEETEKGEKQSLDDDHIHPSQADERAKQMNILQDVLGVAIRSRNSEPESKKHKTKMGMQRFDPSQPEHAKFLAQVEENQEGDKKSKKKKIKEHQEDPKLNEPAAPKVEVSKEQFYKVSETLKEAIAKPATFSLRSLFGNNKEETKNEETVKQDNIPLVNPKDSKIQRLKNPLAPAENNPFVYDSSESESEEDKVKEQIPTEKSEVKAVWKENLFFSKIDNRLLDGLAFFNQPFENDVHKERRELKSLMKKRIYNKERKNQMFQKKIGGRKKTMKKSYRERREFQ